MAERYIQSFLFSIVLYRYCYLLPLQERFVSMKGKFNFIRICVFLLLFIFAGHAGFLLIDSYGTAAYYSQVSRMCSNTELRHSLYFMSDIEDVMHDPILLFQSRDSLAVQGDVVALTDGVLQANLFNGDSVLATKKMDVNSSDNYTIYICSSKLLEIFAQQRINSYFSSDGLSEQGKIQGVRTMEAKEFSPAYFIENGEQVPLEQIAVLEQGVLYPRFIINSNQIKFFDLLYANENAFIVKETPEVMALLERSSVLYDTNLLIVLNDGIDFEAYPDQELKSYLESQGTYVTFDLISEASSDFQNIKSCECISVLIFGVLMTLLSIVITVFSLKMQLKVSDRHLKIGIAAVLLTAFCFSVLSVFLCRLFSILPEEHFYLDHNIYLYLVFLYGAFFAAAMLLINRRYSDGKAIL